MTVLAQPVVTKRFRSTPVPLRSLSVLTGSSGQFGRLCSAESGYDSAVCLGRRDSLTARQRSPARQEKPQSYKTTLRYNGNTPLGGPTCGWDKTDQRKETPTYRMHHLA